MYEIRSVSAVDVLPKPTNSNMLITASSSLIPGCRSPNQHNQDPIEPQRRIEASYQSHMLVCWLSRFHFLYHWLLLSLVIKRGRLLLVPRTKCRHFTNITFWGDREAVIVGIQQWDSCGRSFEFLLTLLILWDGEIVRRSIIMVLLSGLVCSSQMGLKWLGVVCCD